ncbi:hypothetical protein V6N13_139038 [Hibiscus sabdariffa]
MMECNTGRQSPVGIMDRNWMSHRNRFSPEYQEGVRDFLNLAKQNTDSSEDYTRWTHHGESFQPNIDQLCDLNDNDHNSDEVQLGHDDMFEMLDGIQKSTFVETNTERSSMNTETTESEGEVEKFRKLLNDAQRELYPGYALPKGETLPESYYEVIKLNLDGLLESNNNLYVLGLGPDTRVTRYTGIIVNGVRFHSTERGTSRRTQNNGVLVKGVHNSKETDFYGQLTDIIELDYCNGNRVFIFKCDWWNVGDKKNGLRTNGDLISVNVNRKWYTGDPFVLATQVEQVFYIDDVKNGDNWKIVQKTNSRHIYNVPDVEENVSDLASNHEPYQQFEPDSNDVRQINIESNESLNQETEVDEIDSSLLSSKSGSMSNEGAIHASLSDEEEDHDYYDDDTITNYFDDGVGVCEQEEEEEQQEEEEEEEL